MKYLYITLGVTISGIMLMVAYRFIFLADEFASGLAVGLLFVFPLLALTITGAVFLVGIVLRSQDKKRGQGPTEQPRYFPSYFEYPPQQPQQHYLTGSAETVIDVPPNSGEVPHENW